jgi:hypothetical protein
MTGDTHDSPAGAAAWHATALGADDNVATLLEAVAAGQDVIVDVGGKPLRVQALEPIALGHKIALIDLRAGDVLVKYGEAIGEAAVPIARGAWVHVHNLRSLRGRADAPADAFNAVAYMDAAAAALALPIPPKSRDVVAANLTRLAEYAREVLAFDA